MSTVAKAKCWAVTFRTQVFCSPLRLMNVQEWSSSVALVKSDTPRRCSMPTFSMRPGQVYRARVAPPNCASRAWGRGASTVIQLSVCLPAAWSDIFTFTLSRLACATRISSPGRTT